MEKIENKSLCSLCKGQCCKSMPGIVFPSQLKEITTESLTEMFNKGYCFDYWEGDPRPEMKGKYDHPEYKTGYYLRPQTKAKKGVLVDPSWGGECTFLTDTGCSHKYEDRPLECQNLVPSEKYPSCTGKEKLGKREAAIAWIPYHSVIKQTIDENRIQRS